MAEKTVRVLVVGAAGEIGYALLPLIASGRMLGLLKPVILHLLDIPPAAEKLNGVKMELVDAAFPLLKGVVATTDVVVACTGVNVTVMVDGFPGEEGMEERDRMSKILLHCDLPPALDQHAAENCKVLVATHAANTNAMTLKEYAPSIPEKNITCLTRLDGQFSQHPDVNHATVKKPSGEKPVCELLKDDPGLDGEFRTTVQQRVAASAIIKPKKIFAVSVANAVCDHIHDWLLGTPADTLVPMGVFSNGSHNVPAGLIYSFLVTCRNGEWTIVEALEAALPPKRMADEKIATEESPTPAAAAQVPEDQSSTRRKRLDKSLKILTCCFKVGDCCCTVGNCVCQTIDEADM